MNDFKQIMSLIREEDRSDRDGKYLQPYGYISPGDSKIIEEFHKVSGIPNEPNMAGQFFVFAINALCEFIANIDDDPATCNDIAEKTIIKLINAARTVYSLEPRYRVDEFLDSFYRLIRQANRIDMSTKTTINRIVKLLDKPWQVIQIWNAIVNATQINDRELSPPRILDILNSQYTKADREPIRIALGLIHPYFLIDNLPYENSVFIPFTFAFISTHCRRSIISKLIDHFEIPNKIVALNILFMQYFYQTIFADLHDIRLRSALVHYAINAERQQQGLRLITNEKFAALFALIDTKLLPKMLEHNHQHEKVLNQFLQAYNNPPHWTRSQLTIHRAPLDTIDEQLADKSVNLPTLVELQKHAEQYPESRVSLALRTIR